MEEPKKRVRQSTEADRIRAAKWIAEHHDRYIQRQREYARKNREVRNKQARERYAKNHPDFKRISKYRKKEDDKVTLKEKPKPKPVIKAKAPKKKAPKPVEAFTSNPTIIAHVMWIKEHKKQKVNETL